MQGIYSDMILLKEINVCLGVGRFASPVEDFLA
jgi:hypothetical protein